MASRIWSITDSARLPARNPIAGWRRVGADRSDIESTRPCDDKVDTLTAKPSPPQHIIGHKSIFYCSIYAPAIWTWRRNDMQAAKVYLIPVDFPLRTANHAASNSGRESGHPMATAGSSSSKRANELIPISIGVDHPKAAVVAIDLHRGHLDMAVATMPTSPEVAAKVIATNKRLFDWCRSP